MGDGGSFLYIFFHQFKKTCRNSPKPANRAKSLDFALCENEAGALSANQNAGLQCKINSANQGVVECRLMHIAQEVFNTSVKNFKE